MRSFPPLEDADIRRFWAIAHERQPLKPADFLELTTRVTCGEISAMLVRPEGGQWRLGSIRVSRRRATRLSRTSA